MGWIRSSRQLVRPEAVESIFITKRYVHAKGKHSGNEYEWEYLVNVRTVSGTCYVISEHSTKLEAERELEKLYTQIIQHKEEDDAGAEVRYRIEVNA